MGRRRAGRLAVPLRDPHDRRDEGLPGRAWCRGAAVTPDELTDDQHGLPPAVVQEAETGEGLMGAGRDRDAVARTLATGVPHFWWRARPGPGGTGASLWARHD